MLVKVHIVGGSKDLALHLKGLTLRIPVLRRLIEIMRDSGYPGYGKNGVNSFDRVAARLQVRYSEKYAERYGEAQFTPQACGSWIERRAPSSRTKWRRPRSLPR